MDAAQPFDLEHATDGQLARQAGKRLKAAREILGEVDGLVGELRWRGLRSPSMHLSDAQGSLDLLAEELDRAESADPPDEVA